MVVVLSTTRLTQSYGWEWKAFTPWRVESSPPFGLTMGMSLLSEVTLMVLPRMGVSIGMALRG
eukprot:14926649-Heterocapsa_arctica.AAC.1